MSERQPHNVVSLDAARAKQEAPARPSLYEQKKAVLHEIEEVRRRMDSIAARCRLYEEKIGSIETSKKGPLVSIPDLLKLPSLKKHLAQERALLKAYEDRKHLLEKKLVELGKREG